MSSLPDEQSPGLPRRVPLGRLLIAHGLLTEEQLIEGLLEQDRTGDRLGKVLIRLGFVDAPSVAMALASQHGGPLKTEYGFATGFPDGPAEPVTDVPDRAAPQLVADVDGQRDPAVVDLPAFPARRDSSWIEAAIAERDAVQAALDAAHARIADLERELVTAREQLEERRSTTAELEDKVAGARLAAEAAIAALRGVTETPSAVGAD